MALTDFLFGSKSKMKPFNKQSLESLLQLIQSGGGLGQNPLFGAGQSYLQNLLSGSPEAFSAFEAPLKRQFEQETIPGITERFAGMGTGAGGLNSSGLQQSLARAGEGLSTNLGALRGQLQMQALPQALGYAQAPINNLLQAIGLVPGQHYEIPGQPGLVQSGLSSFAQGFGGGFGFGKGYGGGFF